MLYATNIFAGTGNVETFSLNFVGGYLSRAHVKCYIIDNAQTTAIPINPGDWLTDFTVQLQSAAVGQEIMFRRETPPNFLVGPLLPRTAIGDPMAPYERLALYASMEAHDVWELSAANPIGREGPQGEKGEKGDPGDGDVRADTVTASVLPAIDILPTDLFPVVRNAMELRKLPWANLEVLIQQVAQSAIPTGTIVAYNGDIAPVGWAVCDGTGGTPDLRDRFIIGAGNNFSRGQTGGYADATLVAHDHGGVTGSHSVTHNHSGYTEVAGDHSHIYVTGRPYDTDLPYIDRGYIGYGRNVNPGAGAGAIATSGSHQHSFVTDQTSIPHNHTIGWQGGTATGKNIPPCYALVYIIKE